MNITVIQDNMEKPEFDLYTVWKGKNKRHGTGIDEKCVLRNDGNYVGIKTGTVYDKEEYYHSSMLYAEVVSVDERQLNGMIHLDPNSEDNKYIALKHKFIGCTMPFRKAHLYGNLQCYTCITTGEVYNQNELRILE